MRRTPRRLARLAGGANLALLVLFPLAWSAPLLRAGLLPIFGLDTISVLSGIAALARTDPLLAALVALFAIVAPLTKIVGRAAVDFGRASPRWLGPLHALGRLAMADIFLIALYIVVAKGVGVGRIETGWGLYLLTGCVLASLALSQFPPRRG